MTDTMIRAACRDKTAGINVCAKYKKEKTSRFPREFPSLAIDTLVNVSKLICSQTNYNSRRFEIIR